MDKTTDQVVIMQQLSYIEEMKVKKFIASVISVIVIFFGVFSGTLITCALWYILRFNLVILICIGLINCSLGGWIGREIVFRIEYNKRCRKREIKEYGRILTRKELRIKKKEDKRKQEEYQKNNPINNLDDFLRAIDDGRLEGFSYTINSEDNHI